MKRRNYGIFPLIIGLAIAIPILIFGGAAAFKAIEFMNTPIIGGSIPVWAIIVFAILVLLIMKRRQTNPYMV